MAQLTLYREWRPQRFQEVVGQEHVCRTLKNAILLERLAHAYLFCGPRGTGKTSTARILAKAANCPQNQDGEPCNSCDSCRDITNGVSFDVLELDAASHRGIEEIRDLKQKAGFAPTAGRYKFYIIDEVHMLTGEAFNALLKTLEEPPRSTIFVLATTEVHRVPATILSRCQRFDFRRLGRQLIATHLQRVAAAKGWQVEPRALRLMARQAGGALRDALGLLDQAASYTGGKVTAAAVEALTGSLGEAELMAVLQALRRGDIPSLLERLDSFYARGCEPGQVLYQLTDCVRDALLGREPPEEVEWYTGVLRALARAEAGLRGNSRPDLALELALLRLVEPSPEAAEEGSGREQDTAGRPPQMRANPRYTTEPEPSSQTGQNSRGTALPGQLPGGGNQGEAGLNGESHRNAPESPRPPQGREHPQNAAEAFRGDEHPRSTAAPRQAARGDEAPGGTLTPVTLPQEGQPELPWGGKHPQDSFEPLPQHGDVGGNRLAGNRVAPSAQVNYEEVAGPPEGAGRRDGSPGGEAGATPPAGGRVDLKALRRFLEERCREHPLLGKVLAAAKLQEVGGRIGISAPPPFGMLLKKEENRRILQGAVREYDGSLVLEVTETAPGEREPVAGEPAARRPSGKPPEGGPAATPRAPDNGSQAAGPAGRVPGGSVAPPEAPAAAGDQVVSLALSLFKGKLIKRRDDD